MPPSRGPALTATVAAALGSDVTTATRLTGGDVAESYRMVLADGRTVFAKTHASPPPGFFTTEATGLRWLRDPGVVAVPEVLAVSDGDDADGVPPHLVLEWIDEGRRPGPGTDTTFGRALARLHHTGFPVFGRPDRRTTGSRGLPNEPCETWAEFYGSQRLEPLGRLAHDSRSIEPGSRQLLDRVIERLPVLGVPNEPPARLHGDLWAGNRLIDTAGTSWLVDPAAHGGHREFDLAMMQLFGGFGTDCFDAYHEEHPLADGWRQRVPLHQLAPLIVHAIKFGGGYVPAVDAALRSVLSTG